MDIHNFELAICHNARARACICVYIYMCFVSLFDIKWLFGCATNGGWDNSDDSNKDMMHAHTICTIFSFFSPPNVCVCVSFFLLSILFMILFIYFCNLMHAARIHTHSESIWCCSKRTAKWWIYIWFTCTRCECHKWCPHFIGMVEQKCWQSKWTKSYRWRWHSYWLRAQQRISMVRGWNYIARFAFTQIHCHSR